MKRMKKILALLLALTSVISMLVLPANAATTGKLYWLSTTTYIKTYTIKSSGTVQGYTSSSLTTAKGTITCSSDECYIVAVSGNAVQVSYPLDSGGRTTRWFNRSDFTATSISGSLTMKNTTAQITTYRRSTGSTTYGYIGKGDVVYVLGTSGSRTQVIYPLSDGTWKMGWITTTNASNYLKDTSSTQSSVKSRLDQIANGTLTLNSSTVLKTDSTFVGTKSSEQCKGYAKDVFYLCFGVWLPSTQSKPNNYLLSSSSNIRLVGSVTSMSTAYLKSLFVQARPGDVIQFRHKSTCSSSYGSHSAIVYSVSSSGVTVLEANYDGNNSIRKYTYTWSALNSCYQKLSVYSASSYALT